MIDTINYNLLINSKKVIKNQKKVLTIEKCHDSIREVAEVRTNTKRRGSIREDASQG